MSFQPVIPLPGIAGWQFLQRTYDRQFNAFNRSPILDRDTEHFLEAIDSVRSAADLVSDRRLLGIALGAFGLQDDIDNRYFIQKILEEGTTDTHSLANKLADPRYQQLSEAFQFGPGEVRTTGDVAKMVDIVDRFRVQSFEISVGDQDESMRIALFAQHELARLSVEPESEETKWFSLMGLPPLRKMFEVALGLPASFGKIDIDQQMETFREKTRVATGDDSVGQFRDRDAIRKVTELYLARSQISARSSSFTSQTIALSLLRAI